jgi:hypothetical protein
MKVLLKRVFILLIFSGILFYIYKIISFEAMIVFGFGNVIAILIYIETKLEEYNKK